MTESSLPPLARQLANLHQPYWLVRNENQGNHRLVSHLNSPGFMSPALKEGERIFGFLPALPLTTLGDPEFKSNHKLKYAYVTGAMANGIASAELVEAASSAGFLGFFGAAGLNLSRIEEAAVRLRRSLEGQPFGFNLIHNPNEPEVESATVELYLKHRIRLIEAAAFLKLTLPVVRFRVEGIQVSPEGRVVTPNAIIAKVSRVEVATQFLSPPPDDMLDELVRTRKITSKQAEFAKVIPVAEDVTAEADSAGHTDNRPLVTMLPTFLALRNRLQSKYRYRNTPRIGAAGGLSTPASLAAAFALGAAYVVTGSVNQACIESGSSNAVRKLLASAEQADTAMAPAADMFEMGVKVQVLKRGTLFPMRAAKLYELYRSHPSLESIPESDRTTLERQFFKASINETWARTRDYFLNRDTREVERAERDPKHKMALVFRSYLGLSSRWANAGDPTRIMDYQVWCGPAMGAFNEWVKGTPLQHPENRHVAYVGTALLFGSALHLRAMNLRLQNFPIPPGLDCLPPLAPESLRHFLENRTHNE